MKTSEAFFFSKNTCFHTIFHARDTHHEKIIRGLSLGIALILYGQLDNPEATKTIDELSKDKEPLLRRAACLATGLAWVGTGSNDALSKMLHTAVSDVNDDVRRASVQAIGFILARNPENCPHVVELLSHSYNPHVRAGSATALGISCASTGNKEALTLLEPMMNDPVNYVRQAASIAASMILIQHTEHSSNGKSKQFRDLFTKMVEDKHEDVMGKFGAMVAQGIIDAGGRNCSIHLADQHTGHVHMPSIVGMTCFLSTWYWFPMSHFLSLALRPASTILLNKDLKMPKMQVRCASKPSAFAYPSKIQTKVEKKKEKVETAVLSVINKKKVAEDKAKKAEDDAKKDEMETDDSAKKAKKSEISDKSVKNDETETKSDESAEEKPKKKKEPNHCFLENSFRALPSQLKLLSMPGDAKYAPVKSVQSGGIILVNNRNPEEEEVLVERVDAEGPKTKDLKDGEKDEAEEAVAPAAFEWDDAYDQDEVEKMDEDKKDEDKKDEVVEKKEEESKKE